MYIPFKDCNVNIQLCVHVRKSDSVKNVLYSIHSSSEHVYTHTSTLPVNAAIDILQLAYFFYSDEEANKV